MANNKHRRFFFRNFLSSNQCKELEFIHKSCCTVGYRPNIFSTTVSHLIATNSSHLILPFVPIRESLKEKVEEYFDCEYELCIEFTGLVSWTKGSSIGWHSDDNRPYLKQRTFAAVCYLNNYGEDFRGGLFHFQDGEPSTIVPMAGDVLLYTADSQNIHSVEEITDGERVTLTMWFTRDSSFDEDAKLLLQISLHRSDNRTHSYIPTLASNNMYLFPPNGNIGFNICCARIYVLGYYLYSSNSSFHISDLLMDKVQLARDDQLFCHEFVNVLHALQVLQFHHWRASESTSSLSESESKNAASMKLTQSQHQKIRSLNMKFVSDPEMAEMVFGCHKAYNFEVAVSHSIPAWETYSQNLCQQFSICLPHWTAHGSLFHVPSITLSEED